MQHICNAKGEMFSLLHSGGKLTAAAEETEASCVGLQPTELTRLMKHRHLFPLLLLIGLLSGCQAQMLAPMFLQPFDGYVKTENPPTYAAAPLGSMPANKIGKATASGLVLHRGDKILVTKRMDPNWFVFSQQGQEYFIAFDYVSTSPN